MRRKLQHAGCFQRHFGDTERPNVLLDIDHFFVLAEEYQVDRKEHADGMDATGWHDPQATTELCPPTRLTEQTDQPTKIAVGQRRFGSHKGLACLVINV